MGPRNSTCRLVLIGPPGSGKTTQGARLAERLGLTHISTGELVREEVARNTPLGEWVRGYLERGELVPDEIVNRMVRERIKEAGFILDGYPRTLSQAQALTQMLEALGLHLQAAILLEVDEETVVARLSSRWVCSRCEAVYNLISPPQREGLCDRCGGTLYQRDDDRPDLVRKRLGEYRAEMAPVIDYYRKRGLLRPVDGEGSEEEVYRRIWEVLS